MSAVKGFADARLCAFDLETDGVDVEDARIITASVLLLGGGQPRQDYTWMLKPEREIPAEATAIHGITTERAQTEGIDRAAGIAEILDALAWALGEGMPIVAYNAKYDLTVQDRESRRIGAAPVIDRLGGQIRPVIDPLVLDKQVDRYRKGSRKLSAACALYGVTLDAAHDSTADALAAAKLAYKLAATFREVGDVELGDLHDAQVLWYREQQAGLKAHFAKQGKTGTFEGSWPLTLVGARDDIH